ncbi:hypothetical protein [Agromyces badenianii]|uniref:hypothetical protein n=1 Tax=Agromyces badenianii TaxID=2080742 RepID=UPI000D592A61|nr:hypothetical protein [Agromyces badenianii]PWC04264.1 hypothetical protein DCE94_08910 [Agromyces badenianii]
MQPVRITRPARKHRIGNGHILAAIQNATNVATDGDATIFIGSDDRGVELEIVAVPDDRNAGGLAVIHAMPTEWRNR